AADRLPQRLTVIQIIRNDSALFACGLHRLLSDSRRALGQRAKNAAGMEPARAVFPEDFVPIDVTHLELRGCGVAAIRASERRPHPEAAFGKVQSVANRTPHAVIRHPAHELL